MGKGNSNLILAIEPQSYNRKKHANNTPRIRKITKAGTYLANSTTKDQYYTVFKRCRENPKHYNEPAKVFLCKIKDNNLLNIFDDVSTHCLACGAEEQ